MLGHSTNSLTHLPQLINKKYLHTFISFATGNEETVKQFLNGDDESKADAVCHVNKRHWQGKIDAEVEEWIRTNWETWVDTKPRWFTKETKERMPTCYIPDAYDREEMESERRKGGSRDYAGKIIRRLSQRALSKAVGHGRVARVGPTKR